MTWHYINKTELSRIVTAGLGVCGKTKGALAGKYVENMRISKQQNFGCCTVFFWWPFVELQLEIPLHFFHQPALWNRTPWTAKNSLLNLDCIHLKLWFMFHNVQRAFPHAAGRNSNQTIWPDYTNLSLSLIRSPLYIQTLCLTLSEYWASLCLLL